MHAGFGVVGILCGLVLVSGASALTYQDGTDVQFTFNSTLSISLSDTDIVIGNLIPGQDDTSNAVDVVVNTNNLYGYTLTATVGSATKNYRDLRHTNGTASFASIDVNSDLSTLSGESSSVWGYTTSTNGTTWSNYNGLPKYDDTANTAELNVTDGAAEDSTTSFKIGAYAAEGQLAGDYTNVINFEVVSNMGKVYMQDMTASLCTTTPTVVYDKRDENDYIIQRLADGNCWMLDNLRLGGTEPVALTPANTNIPSNFTLPASSPLFNPASEPFIMAAYSDYESNYDGGTTKVGVFYNFCAASGGTYCYNSGQVTGGDAQYDVCPKQWRLTLGGNSSEYQALMNQYSDGSDYQADYGYYENEDFLRALHIGLPGHYNNGYGLVDKNYTGSYWTSTKDDEWGMFVLDITYDSSPGDSKLIFVNLGGSNELGYPIRCVLDEP